MMIRTRKPINAVIRWVVGARNRVAVIGLLREAVRSWIATAAGSATASAVGRC